MICIRPVEVDQGQRVLVAAARAMASLRWIWTLLVGGPLWGRSELMRPSLPGGMEKLAATISHEIKQPLAAATINAMTCARWLSKDQPNFAEARASAERIVRDMGRALEIVDRVSALFGMSRARRDPVDVNDVVRQTLCDLGPEADRRSVSLGVDLAFDLPIVEADRVQLQQVLMNLVRNAIEAMQETGGELTVTSERSESGVLLSISDTGVGLPTSEAEAIFEAFFTTKSGGTGIGLSISRCIIESHGGQLWAERKAQGATFHFTLPDGAHR